VNDILVVSDSLIFLACAYQGMAGILASIDGGDTYTEIHNDGLQFEYGNGFTKCYDGRLLLYNSSGLYISRDTIMEADSVIPFPNSINLTPNLLDAVTAYPNPCSMRCGLNSTLDKAVIGDLYNCQSNYIYSVTIPAKGETTLDFSGLPAGLYFLRYIYNHASGILKIVHQ
jgi:hypothetical protein